MLTRRAALKGGTAVAVSAAVGTATSAVAIPVSANPDAHLEALHAEWRAADRADEASMARSAAEPLLDMEREWFAWRDHCCNYPDESDAARDPLFDRLIEMEVQMHRTPATTPAGIAVKLRMWARHHGFGFDADWWQGSVEDFGHNLDVVPIIGALRDAERLAEEVTS